MDSTPYKFALMTPYKDSYWVWVTSQARCRAIT